MTIPAIKGNYNDLTQKVYPPSTSTWSGLSGTTWANWTQWAYESDSQIVWNMPMMNLGSTPKNFSLNINTVAEGTVSYKIYTSLSGDMNGEETETVVANGAASVPSFYGRFVMVYVIVDQVLDMPTLSSAEITINDAAPTQIKLTDLDTSSLGGTITARPVPLRAQISRIVDMIVVPKETSTPYALDVYVTNTPTSTYLIPKVISKSISNPTFALVGVDNQPRDGIVDITLSVLPLQFMDGNNLKS